MNRQHGYRSMKFILEIYIRIILILEQNDIFSLSWQFISESERHSIVMEDLISRGIVPLFINDFHGMNEIQVPNFVVMLESFTDTQHLSILLIEVRFRPQIPKSANESAPQIIYKLFFYNYRILIFARS